jgi:nitroreductase
MASVKQALSDWVNTSRWLIGLYREGRLGWTIRFAEHRYRGRLQALWAGLERHRDGEGDLWDLRRNIHRIEKGLLHRTSKAVFAEDYIGETVGLLQRALTSNRAEVNSLSWAAAVLTRYFAVCEHSPRVRAAFERFDALEAPNPCPTWQPYEEAVRPELSVEFPALHQLAMRRRSVRFFLDTPVDIAVVRDAMRIAALSPSSCNRQSFRFLFFDEPTKVERILAVPGGFAGFRSPAVIVVLGMYRAYFDARDVNTPIVDASLATMSFLFALETLGLASVCINWPALPDRDENIRKIIDLGDDEVVVMLIGLGHPDPQGRVAYSAKRDLESLLQIGR